MTNRGTVANLLRELREQRGTTLRRAADDLGVAPSHLSRLERGVKYPSSDLAVRAAQYYNIDPDLLALERGEVPEDVLEILRRHPSILNRLRAEYGPETEQDDQLAGGDRTLHRSKDGGI
jgi:transcriptional regulator with XRE-family HTH domain